MEEGLAVVERPKSSVQDGLTVIIPAFNEEGALRGVLEKVSRVAGSTGLRTEVIVVDDGSRDRTAEVAATTKQARLIRHRENRGYGAALKTGIRHATHPLICILDADGTYSPRQILDLIDHFRENEADMVIGARVGREAAVPWARRPAKWLINRFAGFVAGQPIPDVNSGLRLFARTASQEFFGLLPDGFSFTTTLTLAMLRHGYIVEFLPIQYHPRVGRSKIRPIADTLEFVRLISRIALYFAPLKVFLPLSGLLLLLAGGWAAASWYLFGRVADASTAVIAMAAVQLGAVGLLAELVNARLPTHSDRELDNER